MVDLNQDLLQIIKSLIHHKNQRYLVHCDQISPTSQSTDHDQSRDRKTSTHNTYNTMKHSHPLGHLKACLHQLETASCLY